MKKPWKLKNGGESEKWPLWSLMRSFLAGWGGVAFFRARLAAILEAAPPRGRSVGLRSSSIEESKTTSSKVEEDLAFFIEVEEGEDEDEVAPLERFVGRDMKWMKLSTLYLSLSFNIPLYFRFLSLSLSE